MVYIHPILVWRVDTVIIISLFNNVIYHVWVVTAIIWSRIQTKLYQFKFSTNYFSALIHGLKSWNIPVFQLSYSMIHAFVLRACVLHAFMLRACVRACVHGNVWELMGTSCVVLRHAASCVALFCDAGRFYVAFLRCKAFFHYVFAMQGVFSLRFSRFKVFFHYVFAMQGVFFTAFFSLQGVFSLLFYAARRFSLRFCDMLCFLHCDFALQGVLHCVFVAFLSRSMHFLSHNLRVFVEPQLACVFWATTCVCLSSRNIHMFVEPQRVCHPR